ncbi:FAD binding domain protein [Aspergillus desertorum]
MIQSLLAIAWLASSAYVCAASTPALALASIGSCCHDLTIALGAKVSYPDSAAYNASVSSYWSQQEQLLEPSCVISPTSAQDVSIAMTILVPRSCKFAIRSGGHGALAGIANIEEGVTIDLRALDGIQISPDASSVSVGPGQRWGNVYAALDARGVFVPGGRDSPVGVGGATLGGGFNYFAPLAGFACDNVISFEVVLANGSIITATNSTHGDLWLALKGSGNNLGIVTNFVFSTSPLGDVWGGQIYYPISTLDAQLTAFHEFVADPDYDAKAGLMLNFAFSAATGPLIMDQLAYAAPVQDPAVFTAFTEMQPHSASTTRVSSLGDLSIQTGMLAPPSSGQIVFGITLRNTLSILQQTFNIWNASTTSISHIPGIAWSLSLVPIVPAITAQSALRGGNVLGLDDVPPEGLILVLLSASFNSTRDDPAVDAAAEKLGHNIINAAKAEGAYNDYVDYNHPGRWQHPIASYGRRNQRFIRETAERYDPDGVFQVLCPGGFKI